MISCMFAERCNLVAYDNLNEHDDGDDKISAIVVICSLSVICCLSVTRVYSVKAAETRIMRFTLKNIKMSPLLAGHDS